MTRVNEKSSRAPERALRSQPTAIAKQIFALCAVARHRPRIFPECYILLQRVIYYMMSLSRVLNFTIKLAAGTIK